MPEALGWNATNIHEESTAISKKLTAQAVEQRHNVLYDGSGRSRGKMLRMAQYYAKHGYEVHVVHVTVPSYVSVNRAAKRFLVNPFGVTRKEKPSRYAPLNFVFNVVDAKPDGTYEALKESPHVTSGVSLDNNVPLGDKPIEQHRFDRRVD